MEKKINLFFYYNTYLKTYFQQFFFEFKSKDETLSILKVTKLTFNYCL